MCSDQAETQCEVRVGVLSTFILFNPSAFICRAEWQWGHPSIYSFNWRDVDQVDLFIIFSCFIKIHNRGNTETDPETGMISQTTEVFPSSSLHWRLTAAVFPFGLDQISSAATWVFKRLKTSAHLTPWQASMHHSRGSIHSTKSAMLEHLLHISYEGQ